MVFPAFGLQYALIGGGLSDNVQAHIGRRIDDIAGCRTRRYRSNMPITPEQIRAARALLRLDQSVLAQEAGVSLVTLRRLEDRHGLSKVTPATADMVRRTLEKPAPNSSIAEFARVPPRRTQSKRQSVTSIRSWPGVPQR